MNHTAIDRRSLRALPPRPRASWRPQGLADGARAGRLASDRSQRLHSAALQLREPAPSHATCVETVARWGVSGRRHRHTSRAIVVAHVISWACLNGVPINQDWRRCGQSGVRWASLAPLRASPVWYWSVSSLAWAAPAGTSTSPRRVLTSARPEVLERVRTNPSGDIGADVPHRRGQPAGRAADARDPARRPHYDAGACHWLATETAAGSSRGYDIVGFSIAPRKKECI